MACVSVSVGGGAFSLRAKEKERNSQILLVEASLSCWLPFLRRELLFFPAGSFQGAFNTNPNTDSKQERLEV